MKIFNFNIKLAVFSCIAVGIIATGCEKRLDVQPYQGLSDDKALLTESDVSGTLVGAYDAVSNAARGDFRDAGAGERAIRNRGLLDHQSVHHPADHVGAVRDRSMDAQVAGGADAEVHRERAFYRAEGG